MRILHIQHPYIPEKGYQENHLPAKQQELGHDVRIVTSNKIPSKFESQIRRSDFSTGEHRHKGVIVERLPSVSAHDAATILTGLKDAILSFNPDVIHSHRLINAYTIQSLFASRNSNYKIFFDCHIDNDNFHLDNTFKQFSYSIFKRFVLPATKRSSEKFLVTNPFAKKFLISILGIDECNVELLPLGVDTDLFYQSEIERNHTREELTISDSELLYIFAGNISPTKDLDLLIDAFSEVVDSIPESRLLIIGEGNDELLNQYKSQVSSLGLENKIQFHDFVDNDELSMYYNAADVGVWPGKLGITIVEAVACGLPTILCSSLATEFLTSRDNALTFHRGKKDQLVKKLLTYAKEETLRRDHSKNAVQLAKQELSWESVAKKSIKIYSSSL